MTSLNPVLTIGRQITETLEQHQGIDRAAADRRALELLEMVGIADPGPAPAAVSAPALRRHAPARDDRHGARLQSQADHRRRADHGARRHHPGADPRADEDRSRAGFNVAQIIITHNLGVVARYASRVNVMYAGRIVEGGQRRRDLSRPPPSLHHGAAALRAASRPAAAGAPRSRRRPAARPHAARRRLRLPRRAAASRSSAAAASRPALAAGRRSGPSRRLLSQRRAARSRGQSPHERRGRSRRRSWRCASSPCTSPFPRES